MCKGLGSPSCSRTSCYIHVNTVEANCSQNQSAMTFHQGCMISGVLNNLHHFIDVWNTTMQALPFAPLLNSNLWRRQTMNIHEIAGFFLGADLKKRTQKDRRWGKLNITERESFAIFLYCIFASNHLDQLQASFPYRKIIPSQNYRNIGAKFWVTQGYSILQVPSPKLLFS